MSIYLFHKYIYFTKIMENEIIKNIEVEELKKEKKKIFLETKEKLIHPIFEKYNLFYYYLNHLFYYKFNYTNLKGDVLSYFYRYQMYHNTLIENKKYKYNKEIEEIQNNFSFLLDDLFSKNSKKPQNLIKDKHVYHNRNETYFVNHKPHIYCKKITYNRTYYINEQNYTVDFDIFDKCMEIFIQNILYEECQLLKTKKILKYNPIPYIDSFYLYSDFSGNLNEECDSDSKIINGSIYIEMEKVGIISLDRHIQKKMNEINVPVKSRIINLCNIFIELCNVLIVLQKELSYVHGDLKGSNVMLDKTRVIFIDFEFSYLKKVDQNEVYHIYGQESFIFDENYDMFENQKNHYLRFTELYSSKYAFCSDLLYLFLATLVKYNEVTMPIIEEFFCIKEVNMMNVLIQNKAPFEAYVYSKDFILLSKICMMFGVPFEAFVYQFTPENAKIKLLNIIQKNQ